MNSPDLILSPEAISIDKSIKEIPETVSEDIEIKNEINLVVSEQI